MNLNVLTLAPATDATALPAAAGGSAQEGATDFADQLDARLGRPAAADTLAALSVADPATPPATEAAPLLLDATAAETAALATEASALPVGLQSAAAPAAARQSLPVKGEEVDVVSQLAAALGKLTPATATASRDVPREGARSDKQEATQDDQQAIASLFAMLGLPQPVISTPESATAKATPATDALTVALPTARADRAPLSVSNDRSHLSATPTDTALPAAAPAASQSLESAALALASSATPDATDAQRGSDVAAPAMPDPTVLAAPATATPLAASSSAPPAAASAALGGQLASPEWQQALGQQVLLFSRQGHQSAELRLHPEDLGALQISLRIDNDQAQLHFASAHQQVRAAVEAAMPHLRTALAESGINLGQSSVGGDASGWQQAQQQGSQGGTSQRDTWRTPAPTAEPLAVPASLAARLDNRNGVDIFA
ncbi:flagellar hook-length control protein FliK [Nissabacter sp. SGAir0207]|uniref:flagellar hook-length control protein FliK n=1 Tax=Nissabacter sp. SGAir0207 TaxID=2126321 RepID=UPI001F0DB387|nr:flagellar hook-length control protein FliK [Nissabacter sp. SGAir0207]